MCIGTRTVAYNPYRGPVQQPAAKPRSDTSARGKIIQLGGVGCWTKSAIRFAVGIAGHQSIVCKMKVSGACIVFQYFSCSLYNHMCLLMLKPNGAHNVVQRTAVPTCMRLATQKVFVGS